MYRASVSDVADNADDTVSSPTDSCPCLKDAVICKKDSYTALAFTNCPLIFNFENVLFRSNFRPHNLRLHCLERLILAPQAQASALYNSYSAMLT